MTKHLNKTKPWPQVGLCYREPLHHQLVQLQADGVPFFCEIHAETLLATPGLVSVIAELSDQGIPIYLHSTSLNFADAKSDETTRIEHDIALLARRVRATFVSGHLADGKEVVGPVQAFTRPAYTHALCEHVVQRMTAVESMFACPTGIENVACYGELQQDEYSEISFLNDVASALGRRIVFDVSNYLTNHVNGRVADELDQLDVTNVEYFHISGGRWVESVYVDTHGDQIPNAHLTALAAMASRMDVPKVVYERDVRFERQDEIQADLDRVAVAIGLPVLANGSDG